MLVFKISDIKNQLILKFGRAKTINIFYDFIFDMLWKWYLLSNYNIIFHYIQKSLALSTNILMIGFLLS